MQLLKHSFPKILFFTLFPLAFSLISYLIETFFISYFRSSSEFSIEENRSILESQFPFGIALLKNLRGFLMSSYYSYFHFMGMMLILHIVSMIFQKVLLLLKKEFPQSQEKSDSPPQTPMKLFQSLIYFTISYYLCHLLIPNIHSMSLTPSLPQLENISPYNPHSQPSRILEAEEIHQKPHQNQSLIPQEISPYLFEIRTPKSNSQDPLPLIARDKGALAVVVSKDGKKLFRLTEQISGPHTISAADISDAFTVKDSPSYTMNLEFCYQTLAISNDSSTLFVIDCAKFHVFNVSEVRSPPKLISSVQFAEWNSSSRNRSRNYNHKPSVALYEEENAIIIVNNGLHIYNLTDIENPTRIYENKTFPLSPVTIVSKQKKALFGGKNGLIAYNISDLTNPKPLNLKLNLWKDQFIFTIHLSNDEKMVHIGALIPTQNNDTQIKIYALLLKNTQDMSIEETVKVDGLSSCRATSSLLPDSVLPDFKIAHDTNYLYWACGKDYGYFDTSDPKLVTFTSVAPINAIALAHNSRIFLRVDSEQINLFALYQNIQRNESFIWKPNFGHSLKLSPNISHVIIPKMADRLYFVNQTSDNKTILQSYSTRLGVLIQGLSLEIPAKPLFCLASDDGKFLYMKMDPKTIHIALFENSQRPRLLIPITFPEPIDDKFVASSDNKFLIVTKTSKFLGDSVQAAIYTVNMSAPSSSKIKQLVLNADSKDDKQVRYFSQLMLSKDSKTLYIQSAVLYCYNITDLNNPKFLKSRSVTSIVGDTRDSFILSPDEKTAYVMTENIDYQSYKRLVFIDIEKYITPAPFFFMPNLAGNLPIQVSSNGNFLYISTPEHLMEVNITQKSAPFFSRLMKVNMKQFALSKDGKSMYAVIGDRFEIIDLRTKHSLISFKEDFPLGASYTVELKLLQANHIKSYDPVYSNHRFLTTYFFKSSFSHLETEPILSYVVTPTWIHFDKDTSRLTLEPRLPSHLGTYKIYATGSLQVPSDELFESIPTLKKTANDPENILTDLVDRGYLDEDLFITAKFNATRKLLLSPQYSQFEKDIRYFLRDYMTGQEFAFTVSSSLSFEISPSTVKIESLSPHHVVVHIYLRKNHKDLEKNEICQFVQRTYSTPRSILNDPQTLLILDGPLLNINNALQEIIVNFKEPGVKVQALITVFDNMNPSARFELDDVSRYFNLNTKPIPNPSLLIQTQVNKQPLVANRPFSIALHPDSYFDPNNRSLEYTLDTKLDWLDLRGLSLAGTPPKKLLPEKVDVTITIANEFKSEKLTFTLEIGYSGIVLIQYIIVYFGYVFSAYKGYAHFHRFYNVVTQRKYRYPKVHVVSVDQEVTDQTMTPVGFFGKEYENANLLMQYLENYIRKNPKYKNFTREKFAGYFGETSSRHDLSKNKLIKTINLMLEGLTFFERHSVKYYIQVSEEIQETIYQIIFDQIILTEIYHPDERETLKVFNKIKDQWIDIVEPSAWWQFAVNKSKLELAIQNIGASSKKAATYYSGENNDDSITKKNELLDISDNNVRSRYLSNSHVVFNRKISTVEAPLLTEKIAVSSIPEDINMELLELAMKAYAFQSHHINAHREQVTIVSKERMVGSSWFFKLKALLRFHLNELKSANKEDLGYGLKYMFQKNVLHFYGIPDASMEYDTLVVQVLNKREMIMREIYIFGAERQNRGKEQIEPIQEQL